jgi:hypothetical protein
MPWWGILIVGIVTWLAGFMTGRAVGASAVYGQFMGASMLKGIGGQMPMPPTGGQRGS